MTPPRTPATAPSPPVAVPPVAAPPVLAVIAVIAKAPRPGYVKTRLCPPCTPGQAAGLAAAALADTLAAVAATPAVHRVLVLDPGPGAVDVPAGMRTIGQRGAGLGARLAAAFADTTRPGLATFLVGMDTPQLTPALLRAAAAGLATADAVLGPAHDGGWWGLGLRDPRHAAVLADVPMSTPDTGRLTAAALRARGLVVADLPPLRDVDTVADAWDVAATAPGTRFAAAFRDVARTFPTTPRTAALPTAAGAR